MHIPHQDEIISELLKAEPSINRLFLFGSRAKRNKATAFSDIDIGIIADSKLNFYQLARLNEAINRIDTLYKIEVVDFTNREDDFSNEALETIEVLYENE